MDPLEPMGSFQERPLWYDIDGNPISVAEADALLKDMHKRRIALTNLGGWEVSTVHLVLDHGFGWPPMPDGSKPPPMIFETMAFAGEWGEDDHEDVLGPWRYATREGALAGHDRAVAEIKERLDEIERLTGPQHAPAADESSG